MDFELFQQGPAAYIPAFLVGLIITLVAYAAFPLIFAKVRRKPITKKHYRVLCFIVNFIVMGLFIAWNGESSSGGPYILWTTVFSALGIKIMNKRFIIDAPTTTESEENTSDFSDPISPTTPPNSPTAKIDVSAVEEAISEEENSFTETPLCTGTGEILFCRKCGTKLLENAVFCNHCGTRIIKE